jgi:hypothetical protein
LIEVRIERGSPQDAGRRELVIDVRRRFGSAGADPFTAQPADSGADRAAPERTLAEPSGGCLELQASSPTRFGSACRSGAALPTLTSV